MPSVIVGGPDRGDNARVVAEKNRLEARKWLLVKLMPRKYGDMLEVGELEGLADLLAKHRAQAAHAAEAPDGPPMVKPESFFTYAGVGSGVRQRTHR